MEFPLGSGGPRPSPLALQPLTLAEPLTRRVQAGRPPELNRCRPAGVHRHRIADVDVDRPAAFRADRRVLRGRRPRRELEIPRTIAVTLPACPRSWRSPFPTTLRLSWSTSAWPTSPRRPLDQQVEAQALDPVNGEGARPFSIAELRSWVPRLISTGPGSRPG